MPTPAFAGRLAVVCSTTALAVVALGGVASASPSTAGGTPNSHAAAAASTTHGQQNDGKGAGKASSHGTDGTAGTSGDPTAPQPLSGADENTGGANGQCPGGPYCSTRDGSPSLNGNGTGKSVGKPCAGCVGKADNKNPKGQMPNGSDNNAGYECDRNHGIGRGNPAHTGCTSAPSTVTTCPSGQVMRNGACTAPTTETCPAGESMSGLACVLGIGFTRNPGTIEPATTDVVPVSVLGERVLRAPRVGATAASLPFTGAPTGELLALAAAALTVGGALAIAGRRRSAG